MKKNTYPWDRIDALTSQQYRDALLDLEDEHEITEEQQRMLCIHCQARHRTITAKQLARAVPFKGYQAVNAQYGRLARRLWKHLSLPAPPKVRPRYGRWIGLLGSGPVHPGREWEMHVIDRSLCMRLTQGRRYKVIQEYIERNGSKCILLSATPYNKIYLDLSSQLQLFVPAEDGLGIRPERLLKELCEPEFIRRHQCPVRRLAAFEKSEYPDDWSLFRSMRSTDERHPSSAVGTNRPPKRSESGNIPARACGKLTLPTRVFS